MIQGGFAEADSLVLVCFQLHRINHGGTGEYHIVSVSGRLVWRYVSFIHGDSQFES
jgi:hypothetical protein